MVEHKLTVDEHNRNSHGPMHVFKYTKENLGMFVCVLVYVDKIIHTICIIYCLGTLSISRYFPAIEENHSEKIAINRMDIAVDINDLIKGLYPGLQMDIYHIGFPSLHLIPITVS